LDLHEQLVLISLFISLIVGGRGIGSGRRRRNGQPVDDIRVRILGWGDEKSFVGDENGEDGWMNKE